MESRGFPPQLLQGSSKLARWDLGKPGLATLDQQKVVLCVVEGVEESVSLREGKLTQENVSRTVSRITEFLEWLSGRTRRMYK